MHRSRRALVGKVVATVVIVAVIVLVLRSRSNDDRYALTKDEPEIQDKLAVEMINSADQSPLASPIEYEILANEKTSLPLDVDMRSVGTANKDQDVPKVKPPVKKSTRSIVSTDNETLSKSSASNDGEAKFRRNFIKDMMKHAWHGYANHAWGYNEVRPVSKRPNKGSIFGDEKMGATIVDAIDTLYLMGLKDEYLAARTWIELNLDFNKFDADLSVFETNIRYVGGLLSIYALTLDKMFLNKAVQIADKLLPAFDTPSGVPYSNVNIETGYSHNHNWAHDSAILSEFGSMHLEFIYLSYATGDSKYREKAFKIRQAIRKAAQRSDGLYNAYMNTDTGQWLTRHTYISIGATGDSFYEYLIKSYVQSDGQDVEAYQMYVDAIKALEDKLLFTSARSNLVYFAQLEGTSINHKMYSLACFSGGMLAMGATRSAEPIRSRHMSLASGLTNTCHESCVRAKSHLGPEAFTFSTKADAVAFGQSENYYILRPEIIESYFYMWRYTRDTKYRDWAWDFAQSLERYCKSEAGYSGLQNVYEPVVKDDVQQSFLMAEVLKYLYLIFSDDKLVNLDEWVLNTEAHPLPILKENDS
jgi:mannosyl-oligosaccharide alpha-1,2-mannosidase